jgi:hypothetical protein
MTGDLGQLSALGNLRSTPRRAAPDPTPMAFTIDMAWTIVMSSGRTRSAGMYITLPDMGDGACGKNATTQSFSRCSRRYPICQPPSILIKAGFNPLVCSICAKGRRPQPRSRKIWAIG